jgi:ubiquinone/menaquinone biosynthesis C-methylase UbiE
VNPKRLDNALGTVEVETLLARSQPRFFAAIAELDWYSRSHRQWIDDLDIRAGDRVLEVGCAAGTLTAYLDDSGYSVTGLDRSSSMIRRARKTYRRLDLHVGDAMELPYDDDAFDAVVAASVVNVVADAKAVMSEMHRVCAPGGTVSVLVPSTDFTDEDLDVLIETLGLTGFSRAALAKWHGSAPKMSRSQLESLFRGVALEAVSTRSYLDGMLMAVTSTARSD